MKTLGYKITGPDNDTFMVPKPDPSELCGTCGYRTDWYPHTETFSPKIKKFDLSATYDGQWIISSRLKELLEAECPDNFTAKGFGSSPEFFHLLPRKVVAFDAVRRKTRFEKLCPECGNYESVVGAKPSFLVGSPELEHGLFASDLYFGSGNEKHPVLFVSSTLKLVLDKSGLKGIDYDPIQE